MDSSKSTLSPTQLDDLLRKLPEWAVEGGALVRSLTFPGFPQAIAFVNAVAELAERENHHPDIDIRYSRVRLGLVSHDAGGITERDSRMAVVLNGLIAKSAGQAVPVE